MSDTLIIKTISKIHFILVSILLFIGITFSSFYFLLQDGMTIKKIHFSNVKVEQLYIKWNKKLTLDVNNVVIVPNSKQDTQPLNPEKIKETIQSLFLVNHLFEKVTFRNIVYDKTEISLHYDEKTSSKITLTSPFMACKSTFEFNSLYLNINSMACNLPNKGVSLDGNLLLDKQSASFSSDFLIQLPQQTKASLHLQGDAKALDYAFSADNNITNAKEIISLFELGKNLQYWVHDAIELQSLELLSLKGSLEYEKPKEFYKNIHAMAKAHKLHYAYNNRIDAIHSEYTDLEFKDGILFITPHNATSYAFDLQTSRLFIDFTKPEETLTLFLHFDGKLNDDILYLLGQYHISLPLKQNSGITQTDLQILINLRTLKTVADGTFIVKNANIDYLGLNLDVSEGKVTLDPQNRLQIIDASASYKKSTHAIVNADYAISSKEGEVRIAFDKIVFKEANLSLSKESLPFVATYKLSNGNDTLVLPSSIWNFYQEKITLNASEIPFNFNALQATIPIINCNIKDVGSAFLAGKVDLKNRNIAINIDLLDFQYKNFALSQSHTPLLLTYKDDALSIGSAENIYFSLDNYELSLSPFSLEQKNTTLKSTQAKLTLLNLADVLIQANYNQKTQQASVVLNSLQIKESNLTDINRTYLLEIQKKSDSLSVSEKSLQLFGEYGFTAGSWYVETKNLSEISRIAPLVKKYHLDNGALRIAQKSSDSPILFFATTAYPYKILLQKDKHTTAQRVQASYDPKTKSIEGTINEDVSFSIDDDITIQAKDIGVDIHELIALIESFEAKKQSKSKNFYLKALNSYIYLSDNRKIISDAIEVQYFNSVLSAQLLHKAGEAGLKYENSLFDLYGENFNAEFMENLFYLSKFKGGTFSFSMNGTLKNYDGIFYIKDTTIVDYKILNNILAFVNTIPSLVTFSLPGYSSKGLFTNQAYMKFNAKDGALDISDIYLESQEITILGKGVADYLKNSINLELNLKTDLGSSASKIPIVGYILFNEDSISTTLSVTGELTNPTISTLLAKDIIVAPFNIIKRSLLLPYHLLKK